MTRRCRPLRELNSVDENPQLEMIIISNRIKRKGYIAKY
jgi:hypothetical protein